MNSLEDLQEIFTRTTDKEEMRKLFDEVFTSREQNDFALRWSLMNDLYIGMPQREIASKHKISLCKITRGSKILKQKDSFCKKILSDRFDDHKHL